MCPQVNGAHFIFDVHPQADSSTHAVSEGQRHSRSECKRRVFTQKGCASGVNGTAGRAGSAAASLLPAAGAVAGARGAAAAGNGALTSAQVAAQMALCNGTSHLSNNGLTPVRTGLAWATLGDLAPLLACLGLHLLRA